MTNDQHCAAVAGNVSQFAHAPFLKRDIADRKHFIDEQNILVEIGGNGESQSNVHAAGVMLHRSVDELLDFGEADDIVELAANLGAASCRGSRH